MDVLFTFKVADWQKESLIQRFPTCTFHFKRTASCEEAEIAEVIVTYGGNINQALLERAEKLKWIMVASAGIEKLAHEEIVKRDIVVTNVRGIHKTPMAESILGHMLALRRSIPQIYEANRTKDWKYPMQSSELKGSTAMIIGPGAIGAEVGRLLQAFGVNTIGCNRSGREVKCIERTIPFDRLLDELPKADFVISILPSTEQTKGLLTEDHFNMMKESTVFLNFGRGDVLDEEMLIRVLKEERIHHAVLDVFQEEPLPETSAFWSLSNCTVSPHVSSKSEKYIERSLSIFERNLERYLNQEADLENVVNVKQGY